MFINVVNQNQLAGHMCDIFLFDKYVHHYISFWYANASISFITSTLLFYVNSLVSYASLVLLLLYNCQK